MSGGLTSSYDDYDSEAKSGDGTSTMTTSTTSSTKTTPVRSSPSSPLTSRFDCAFRVAVLGDSASGKRFLFHNLIHGKLSKESTNQDELLDEISGVNWNIMFMPVDSMHVRLQIYESKSPTVEPYSPNSFAGTDIVFVVFDIESQESFENAGNWCEVLGYYKYPGVATLVGNRFEKTLVRRRAVEQRAGRARAHEHGLFYAEMSPFAELRAHGLGVLEMATRYALFALTRKESFVAADVALLISETRLTGLQKERLINLLAEEDSSSLLSQSSSEVGARRGLFQRVAKRPPVFAAIEGKDVTKVRSCVSSSASINRLRDPGTKSSPLILCASMCQSSVDLEIASMLLKSAGPGDCNLQNGAGETALMTAMKNAPSKESSSLVRLFLAHSSMDLNVANLAGSNAFHYAAERGFLLLFEAQGGLPDAAFQFNNAMESPIFLAARAGHAQIVSIMAADARVSNNMSNTSLAYSPLHIAVLKAHSSVLKALLASPHVSGSINLPNKELYTPVYLAIEMASEEIKALLLSHGADPRSGRMHRLAPQLFSTSFIPAHLAWAAEQELSRLDLSRCNLKSIPLPLFKLSGLKFLSLANNQLEVIPRQLVDSGTDLEELLLNDNSLRVVPLELVTLDKLRVLRLDGNPNIAADLAPLILAHISASSVVDLSGLHLQTCSLSILETCTELEEIALNENVLDDIGFLTTLPKLKSVWVHDNRLTHLPNTPTVELLKISGNQLRDLSGILQLTQLRELWVEDNHLTQLPLSMCGPSLSRLWLDGNEITTIEPPIEMDSSMLALQCLSLKNNAIREIPSSFVPSLKRLWLDGNLIERLPTTFGSTMTNLRTLSLSGNPLRSFPAEIRNLRSLTELSLNECLLEEVDVSLGNLVGLKRLLLRGNRLQVLPQTLGHLTNLISLDVSENDELSSPPPETVKNGTQAIIGFLHDLIADSKPSYRMKLMLVGQEAVGKTSLLRAITAKQRKPSFFGTKRSVLKAPLSTDGIDIEQWDRRIKLASKESLKINFRAWDFAGQEVYYSTHAFFLSNRSVYMVIWSLEFSDDQQRVTYWLQSIQSRAPKAPVILVGTHAEKHSAQALAEMGDAAVAKHRAKFPNLNIAGFIGFSASSGLNLQPLMDLLDTTALAQPFMGEPLPTLYLNLEQAVLAERKRVPPVMNWEEFTKLGTSCGVLREEELLRAVVLLHEMGSLFFFKPVDKAAFARMALVVLDPQWLTKVMAQVITTKSSFVRNGMLDHKDVSFMWKPPEYPSVLHAPLLNLLQSFDISFRMDGSTDPHMGKSLIPAMLPFRSMADKGLVSSRIKEYGVTMGRIFDFDFLPAGFFSRLTVRVLHMAKAEEVWADHVSVSLAESIARISASGMTISVTVQGESYCDSLLQLLKICVQNLESLAEEWFQIRATTKIPCVHCLKQNSAKPPHLFDLQECEQAASDGLAYVSCCGQFPVSLVALCPDVIVSTDLPVVKWDALLNQERIGEGTFAYVYRAFLNDRLVAVKRLIDETDYRELRKEAASLSSLKHRNVVELLGVCYKPAALITEFMSKGSLFDHLQDASVRIPWSRRWAFATDIAAGMNFLHTTTPPIIHRDCKSANVLLTDDLTCKISDFGTVTMIAPFTTGKVVTNPRWQAPEVLLNLPYGSPADVYAFGIVLWELCTREIPFTDKPSYAWAHNVEDDVCRGNRPPVRDSFPDLFADLMVHCWQQEPESRPTFSGIVRTLQTGLEGMDDNAADAPAIDIRDAQLLSPRNK